MNQGKASLKKPFKHVGGANMSWMPWDLETETNACEISPVKYVCFGMKTTVCRTFALAEEIEAPMRIYLEKMEG